MPHIDVDGDRIYYSGDVKKDGTPLVFCHGSGGKHLHFINQLEGLQDVANPIGVDFPGHGQSEGNPMDRISKYSDWLHRFCKSLNIGPLVLAGHSMGGAITLDYALNHPANLLGLVIMGSGGRLRVLPDFLDRLREGNPPTVLAEYRYGSETSEEIKAKGLEEIKATPPALYFADFTACNNFDVLGRLPQVSQPTLIICGTEDKLTPVKYSNYLAEQIVQAKLVLIEGAGHMSMIEKPEAVNKAIADFIEQLGN